VSLTELEQLVRTGRYTQAMRVFLDLLRSGTLAARDLALAFHCASICQYQSGKVFPALEFAKKAEEQAAESDDGVLLRRVWSNLIAFYMDLGDTHMAVSYGESWLNSVEKFPELAGMTAKVHFNMAQTFRVRREFDKMFEHLETGAQYVGDLSVPRRVHFYQTYAWCLYAHERIAEGDLQAQRATELVEESDVEGIREQLLLKGYRAYQIGDIRDAMRICEEFLNPDLPTTKRQEFWALWMIGMAACDNGNFAHALAMGSLALDLAMGIKHAEFMNRAGELRSRALRLGQLHNGDGSAG